MADEETSIYDLFINSNQDEINAASEALARLTAQGMSVNDALAQINSSSQAASDGIERMAAAASGGAGQAATTVESLNNQLINTQTQTERVIALLAQMRSEAATSAIPEPGPEFFPGLEQGAASRSMFGVGHALSVAGFMTGAPGLREAGALVYIEEGIKRVMPLFESLNKTIEVTPSLLTPLISGFTALGIPMAGLLATALPVAVAVAGVVLAVNAYNNAIQESKSALQGILSTQDEYYTFIQTATTKDAQNKVQSLTDQNEISKKKLDENVGIVRKYFDEMGVHPLGEGLDYIKNLKASTNVAAFDSAIADAVDKAEKYGAAIANNNILIGRLTGDLQNNTFAGNDAKQALEEQTAAAIKKAGADADYQRQLIADTGLSVEAAKKRIDTLQQEGPVIQGQMDALKPYIETNKEAKQQYDDLNTQLGNTVGEIQYLTNVVIPAAQHLKDLADAAKALDNATKAAEQAHKQYLKDLQSAQDQLANQSADARTRELNQERQYWAGSLQDSFERNKIITDEKRKEDQLSVETANHITDIRTKLGQREVDLLTQYNRQLVDDRTKYQEDFQKLQTGAYRQERDDLQSHLEKLADIQNREAVDQQQALLDRNFLALAKQEQSKQSEVNQENIAYARRTAQLQQHLQDQAADLATHYAEERTQQFVEYQRKQVDARLNANREIEQTNTDEARKIEAYRTSQRQQLIDLTTNETYKLQVLRQGLTQELLLYEQQEQQRLAIAQRAQAESVKQAWASVGQNFVQNPAASMYSAINLVGPTISSLPGLLGSFLGGLGSRDAGGSFATGEAFMKGNIPEMFRFGSQAYSIPGAAMVVPLQSGSASPGNSPTQITIPITIPARNNQDVPAEAARLVYNKLQEFFTR